MEFCTVKVINASFARATIGYQHIEKSILCKLANHCISSHDKRQYYDNSYTAINTITLSHGHGSNCTGYHHSNLQQVPEIFTSLLLPSGCARWQWTNALNISTAWESKVLAGKSPILSTNFIHDSSTLSNASKYKDSFESSCSSTVSDDHISKQIISVIYNELNDCSICYVMWCVLHKNQLDI